MIVGYDAKRLFHNDTGLGVYSRLLIKGIHKIDPDLQIRLFAKNPEVSVFAKDFASYRTISSSKIFWRSWGMTKDILRQECDIFHGLSHELPIGLPKSGIKTLVTIHDVIFQHYPELYPWIDRKIYREKWRYSCLHANKIIAVSRQTKKDLCHFFDVDETKVEVIYPPVEPTINHIAADDFFVKEKLPKEYFLSVGALNKRKNISLIIHAYSLLNKEDRIPLIIVGKGSEKKKLQELVHRYKLNELIQFKDYIASEDLPAYYQFAKALIYPSLYEGFGIPIVESLRNKTPVIASQTSAMPEAAGPGAILINPYQPEDLADAMSQMLTDETKRELLITEGYRHSLQFDPEVIAKEQLRLYRELI